MIATSIIVTIVNNYNLPFWLVSGGAIAIGQLHDLVSLSRIQECDVDITVLLDHVNSHVCPKFSASDTVVMLAIAMNDSLYFLVSRCPCSGHFLHKTHVVETSFVLHIVVTARIREVNCNSLHVMCHSFSHIESSMPRKFERGLLIQLKDFYYENVVIAA